MGEKAFGFTNKQLKSLFYILCLLAVFAFVGYHLYNMLNSDIVTVRAEEQITEDSLLLDAYIARDEQIVCESNSGVIRSEYSAGSKVLPGVVCAGIYPESVRSVVERIKLLDYKADLLSAAMRYTTVADSDENISLSYTELMRKFSGGSADVESEIYSLTLALSQREYSFDKSSISAAYNSTVAELSSLVASLGTPLSYAEMPFSGYFFPEGDRFGETFSASLATSGTADEILGAIATYNNTEKTEANVSVASKTSEWYLLAPVTKEESEKVAKGNIYMVHTETSEFSATLADVRRSSEGDGAVLVLYITELPSSFSYDRMVNISLVIGEERTYRIPSSAIRTLEDGSTGVYIMSGGVVLFRRVEIVKSGESFVLVKSHKSYMEGLAQEKNAENIYSLSSVPSLSVGVYRGNSDTHIKDEYEDGTVLAKSPFGDSKINTLTEDDPSEYSYLEENELVIISGNKLYHGKISS